MISRDDILARLLEPYATLSEEEIAAASTWAKSDPEVAEAWTECQLLSTVSESKLYAGSKVGDAEFIVSLRNKISESATAPASKLFGSRRLVPIAAMMCVGLMALILSTGDQYGGSGLTQQPDSTVENFVSALSVDGSLNLDSLVSVGADPESLATYLDVGDMAQNWDFNDATTEEPLSDLLLALDSQSIEEVLNDLEATNFF
jgi:hypothetical protein